LPDDRLTKDQKEMSGVKMLGTASSILGVVLGCIMGMVSLLFKDLRAAERAKRKQELSTLFETLMDKGTHVLRARRCTLWLVDQDNPDRLWSQVCKGRVSSDADLRDVFSAYDVNGRGFITSSDLNHALQQMGWILTKQEINELILESQKGPAKGKGSAVLYLDEFNGVVDRIFNLRERAIPLRQGGIKHAVISSGKPLRIDHAHGDTRFNQNWDKYTGFKTKSILVVPVLDRDTEKVLGVIVAKNKLSDDDMAVAFTDGDEAVLKTIASHAAAFIRHVSD